MNLLARKEKCSIRVFPAVTATFYEIETVADHLSSDQMIACRLLMLSNKRGTLWQRLLRPKSYWAKFAQAMHLHRKAFAAEVKGQFERADYFWAAVHSAMKPLIADASKWKQAVGSLTNEDTLSVMSDPEQARVTFIKEVLLDVHIAFHNGHAQSESLVTRAFVHFDHIVGLLSMAVLTKDEAYELRAQGWHEQVRLCRLAGDWSGATNACWSLIDCAPDPGPYADVLAVVYSQYGLSYHGGYKEAVAELRWTITCLEDITKDFAHCLPAYQSIGLLYKALAKRLAVARKFADALLATHKAEAYDPALEGLQAIRDQITAEIEQIQANTETARTESSHDDAQIVGSRTGSRMAKALAPSKEYLASEAPKLAREGYRLARAHRLWRSIGLTNPTYQSGAVELRLLEALEESSRSVTAGEGSPDAVFRALTANDPILRDLDAAAIFSYFSRNGTDVISSNELPEIASAQKAQNPPCLLVKRARMQWTAEPLDDWFFSRKDLRIKAQAILAVLLMLTVGVLGLREWSASRTRDQAFLRVLQSENQQQPLSVIEAAEEFFAHLPPVGTDTRTQSVFDHYDRALLRWVGENHDQDKSNLEEHINRYNQMARSVKQEKSDEKSN